MFKPPAPTTIELAFIDESEERLPIGDLFFPDFRFLKIQRAKFSGVA